MSEYIWRDCKKQPPLVDDGELVLMDSKDKFWVGFCKITSDGVSYFANNAEPLKNDFVKYARIEKLLEVESELERTRKALDVAVDALKSAKTRLELINNSKFANLNNVLQIQCQCEVLKINEVLEQITAPKQKDK